ncbi:A disintegrin and metalloproteinase with thrombospondin motifs 8 [Esox lucius]|uniref:Peptidase M12B domain-containing protein n=1 Tax=Esox lucius TaxID=8010 RepID=A0A3P8ZS56_ESOLU|nr:A disintegrin and metalloproteinase with thrombospondin motifs 8 [Esox lucius]
MGLALHISLLALSLINVALSEFFHSEETIPVRTSVRTSGSLWRRSEERQTIRLTAFGQVFTLNLTTDDSFIAPKLRIQRIKSKHLAALFNGTGSGHFASGISETEGNGDDFTGCFYSGKVDTDQDSIVAVSLCRGIQGSFIAHGDEYIIQPKVLGQGKTERTLSQVHVIKRKVDARETSETLSVFDQLKDESQLATDDGYVSLMEDTDRATGRKRRFVSSPRYIETLVVADASMTHFYGDEIKHYLLTLMAVAAGVYRHPSLKNSVSLVVVKMLVVEDEDVGPQVSSNGGMALRNFCNWQQHFNPSSQRHLEHYDTAILLTRQDICGQKNCNTLGVADIGTMCDPKRSCSVIEDNGLQAAFTVTHELGHVLSMPHDDSSNCIRWFGRLDGHHMMASVFVSLNKTMPWSPCSARYVTEFFDNGHGDCLLDPPEQTLPFLVEPPGVLFNLDRQCQQVFGEEFTLCPDTPEDQTCSQLWCREEGQTHCTTRNGSLPWADGTPCGAGAGVNTTCQDGVCALVTNQQKKQEPVDGGWSVWGPWGSCSRSCGGGVEFSQRECTDPEPQNGGSYCLGQRIKYQSCNTQACQDDHSFRDEQCAKYNSDRYLDIFGNIKQWIPKYTGVSPRDRCKLFCRARGSNEFKVFEAKVVDGTTCGPDTTSICVQGQCIKAGCDQVIESNVKLDKCGVCGGDGTTCRKITGSMNKAIFGYNDIVTIPAGATNIDIKQKSHRGIKHDGNYLALKTEGGSYILNGNFSVTTSEQDIPVPGAVLRYSGSSTTLERLMSYQKLRQALTVQLLSTAGDTSPPRIKYTFFLPRDVPFTKPGAEGRASLHAILPIGSAEWALGEWSECSKSCGSGWSRRNVECLDGTGSLSFFCDEDLRPIDIRPCGDLPCPIWQMGHWLACSRTCGVGVRHQSVLCVDYTGKMVDLEKCNPAKRPEVVTSECSYQDC